MGTESSVAEQKGSLVASGYNRFDTTGHPHPLMNLKVLSELERHAHSLAVQLDRLLTSTQSSLDQMSGLTMDCTSTLSNSVDLTCDAVDASIKTTYALMAKCEELSKAVVQVKPLEKEIEAVKRTLDRFESLLKDPGHY
ncbi:unnamed protein product [Dicrocoelium dendriticum]|nr:unnamed protein product [Dicrocoelium dendriticum]